MNKKTLKLYTDEKLEPSEEKQLIKERIAELQSNIDISEVVIKANQSNIKFFKERLNELECQKENDLIFYYNSKDKDITLARKLINDLSEMGISLSNEHKNYIVKEVQHIYGAGSSYGQTRMIKKVKEIIEEKYTELPEQLISDINKYE